MSEARTKWLLRLRSRLYDVMGNNLRSSWSVIYVFVMPQIHAIQRMN